MPGPFPIAARRTPKGWAEQAGGIHTTSSSWGTGIHPYKDIQVSSCLFCGSSLWGGRRVALSCHISCGNRIPPPVPPMCLFLTWGALKTADAMCVPYATPPPTPQSFSSPSSEVDLALRFFFWPPWNLNSDHPCACQAGTLPFEPCLQPFLAL
jgi:hypothetical protein